MSKIKAMFLAAIAVIATPFLASAQIWDATSTIDVLQSTFTNVGLIFAMAIGAILVAWGALIGLGYGLRKAKSYITGKKF